MGKLRSVYFKLFWIQESSYKRETKFSSKLRKLLAASGMTSPWDSGVGVGTKMSHFVENRFLISLLKNRVKEILFSTISNYSETACRDQWPVG